jgi:hypothetical protein
MTFLLFDLQRPRQTQVPSSLRHLPALPTSPPLLRSAIAALRWHQRPMNRPFQKFGAVLVGLACMLLMSCAGKTPGEQLADMPHWIGGEPEGVPPRRGTPEYDSWMAARAEEAARPKNAHPN